MLQLGFAVAIREETVEADFSKSGRQHVEQESPDELVGGKAHHLVLLAACQPVVFITKSDLIVVDVEQALIGEGYTVGIAAQVFEYLLRAAERRLSMDHPFTFGERSEIVEESLPVGQGLKIAKEL